MLGDKMNIIQLEEVSSTNLYAKENLDSFEDKTVIIAIFLAKLLSFCSKLSFLEKSFMSKIIDTKIKSTKRIIPIGIVNSIPHNITALKIKNNICIEAKVTI